MTRRSVQEWKARKDKERRDASREVHHKAARIAQEFGLYLRRVNDGHYELSKRRQWKVNLYPGSTQVIWDRRLPQHHLFQLRAPWTVLDAVLAAYEAMEVNHDLEEAQR